jgi:hypothetical protein
MFGTPCQDFEVLMWPSNGEKSPPETLGNACEHAQLDTQTQDMSSFQRNTRADALCKYVLTEREGKFFFSETENSSSG